MAQARAIPDLRCDEPFRSAAAKVIRTRLEEMMSFRDAALAGGDVEGVHDMRVASRRLRAALELFRDAYPKRRLNSLIREVKALADALGEVRDTDVMLDRLQADMKSRPRSERLVLSDMISDLRETQEAAREHLVKGMGRLEDDDLPRRLLALVAQDSR